MHKLIAKYSTLLIIFKALSVTISVLIMAVFPKFLSVDLGNGSSRNYNVDLLINAFSYFFNIVIMFLILNDLKKVNIKSILIFILTFFSSLAGVVVLLFLAYEKNYTLAPNEK